MKSADTVLFLNNDWFFGSTEAGALQAPDKSAHAHYCSAQIPGSVFHSLLEADVSIPQDADHLDWWFYSDFNVSLQQDTLYQLELDRLAGIVEIWLNGQPLVNHRNMFRPAVVDVSSALKSTNQLAICFRACASDLKQKRPRPRWKTNLVKQQQLRWLRTSLLGRMPGWNPSTPAIGPCGDIRLQCYKSTRLNRAKLVTRYDNQQGFVDAHVIVEGAAESVTLHFGEHRIALKRDGENPDRYSASLVIEQPELWWPHTHGAQPLYDACLIIESQGGKQSVPLGRRAFVALELIQNHGLAFVCNGQPIFIRGACWTINDLSRFWSSKEALRSALILAQQAGMNMLRIGGTMQYEQDAFYELCDELGIFVWQDFMFSSMDYPFDDPWFHKECMAEAEFQISRLSQFASVAVYCGNNEVQQQAAMMGLSEDAWSHAFFDQELPALCSKHHPGTHYFSSTPMGGALPFHIGDGISHFYGVGAYKRSVLSSGLERVRFATETLGFANVPEPSVVEQLFDGGLPACHSPVWKQGVPRDGGAGWDFEDIRDDYFAELFGLDPIKVRSEDSLRYLSLSRVVPGELIKQVFGVWRSLDTCGGGLVWQFNDVAQGAGWGMVDVKGNPKSAYYYAKRAFQPCAAFLLDSGLDGLNALVVNESPRRQRYTLSVSIIKTPNIIIQTVTQDVELAAFSKKRVSVDQLFGHFRDVNFSYKFGAKQHDVVCLEMRDSETMALIAEDAYFPETMLLPVQGNASIDVSVKALGNRVELFIQSDAFLQAVHLDMKGCVPKDNYFSVVPGSVRSVELDGVCLDNAFIKGSLSALNLSTPLRIKIKRVEE